MWKSYSLWNKIPNIKSTTNYGMFTTLVNFATLTNLCTFIYYSIKTITVYMYYYTLLFFILLL